MYTTYLCVNIKVLIVTFLSCVHFKSKLHETMSETSVNNC